MYNDIRRPNVIRCFVRARFWIGIILPLQDINKNEKKNKLLEVTSLTIYIEEIKKNKKINSC